MIITKSQYPSVFRAIALLPIDNAVILRTTVINIPDGWASAMPGIETALRGLNGEQMRDFIDGEDNASVNRQKLETAQKLLDYIFDNYT